MKLVVLIFSMVLIIFGIIEIVDQLKLSESLNWGIPLIFILFGSGGVLFIVFLPDNVSQPTNEQDIANAEEYSLNDASESCIDGDDGD